jgi:hypothetical protein
MSYQLVFHMQLGDDSALRTGRLELIDTSANAIVDRYIATSGAPGWQDTDDQTAKGKGCIPRTDLAQIGSYFVATNPIDLKAVRGVEGSFYTISPGRVTLKSGQVRGDFGVHFDANAPGSAGCVVLTTIKGWEGYQTQMARIAKEGVNQIPLFICYS